jgi:anaerobic selenocysteine-containing dehydrogenase
MTSADEERSPSDTPTRTAVSFCRICSGGCGVVLTIDGRDRIVGVRGDKESPLTRGYFCFKGRQAEGSHYGARRLLRPLKRTADGSYAEISSEQALAEIAAKLGSILDRHGEQAMAAFMGNGFLFNTAGMYMLTSFLTAFNSDQYFSTHTIDQSGKMVTAGRLGSWGAGYPYLEDMEVAIFFGTNPLVSHGAIPFLQSDPVRTLRRARAWPQGDHHRSPRVGDRSVGRHRAPALPRAGRAHCGRTDPSHPHRRVGGQGVLRPLGRRREDSGIAQGGRASQ